MIKDDKSLSTLSQALREGDPDAGRGMAERRWGQDAPISTSSPQDQKDRAKAIAILMIVLALLSRAL